MKGWTKLSATVGLLAVAGLARAQVAERKGITVAAARTAIAAAAEAARRTSGTAAIAVVDGKTLYLAGRTSLYRIRLAIPGVRPAERLSAVARSAP